MPNIRITRTPQGEAPLHIREAWVGIVLPQARGRDGGRRRVAAFGVVSGPRTFFQTLSRRLRGDYLRYDGYSVPTIEALTALDRVNPSAAQWWRQNAPHLIKPNGRFVFEAEVCEEVPYA